MLNGGLKAFVLLLGGERLLWTELRVYHLQVTRQLGCRQPASSNVRKTPIVRNPKDECALRTLTPKSWKGTPDGYKDLLKKILPFRRISRVNAGNASERRPVCLKQSTEPPLEIRRIQIAPEWEHERQPKSGAFSPKRALSRLDDSLNSRNVPHDGQLIEAVNATIRDDCVHSFDIADLGDRIAF